MNNNTVQVATLRLISSLLSPANATLSIEQQEDLAVALGGIADQIDDDGKKTLTTKDRIPPTS